MMKNLLILSIGLALLSSCHRGHTGHIVASQAIQMDSLPGLCPYLTKDTHGNRVLSWVRLNADGSSSFCYATSADGKKFSTPVVIPNSGNIQPHGENLPKIIFKPSGEIIALWGAANPNPRNKYSGLVFYVQSFDGGRTWSGQKPLTHDTASIDQRYYDVALLANGEAAVIWLDNRKTTDKEGSSLYYASTNGRNGFQNEKRIAESCCQCCRTDLFVDRKGDVHVLYRGIIQDSIRDMVHAVSVDGGKTFSVPQRISNDNWVIRGCPHTGPAMTDNQEGVHFAWFTGGKNTGCFYTKSTDNGKNFVAHDSISSLGAHPQLTALGNGSLVIAWDEAVVEGNTVHRKIGVQKRNADGTAQEKGFITPAGGNASYPVLSSVNDTEALVAYSEKKGDKNYIVYRLVDLK
jgi:hypothetical protein